jgi:GNAT superfamily N-acetyltransferase
LQGGKEVTPLATWTQRIGQRVVVRYVTPGGEPNDLVGELVAVDDCLHVASSRGPIQVALHRVVTGKVVPPRPSRPGPPHLVISITDLQRVMALHWQSLQTERLGDWLLRASDGFTGRANSALPLGHPGLEVRAALDHVVAWYRERGLTAKVAVAGPAPDADPRVDPDTGPFAPVREAADAAGWRLVHDHSALVMTARTAALRDVGPPGALPPGLTVTVDPEPDAAWLTAYRYRGQQRPPAAPAPLVSAPEQVFVSVRDGDAAVAVARGSLGGGWAGLTAVEVVPAMRRRGLGRVLLGTVARWAARAGATCLYLQVGESNETATRLYRRAGFAVHHRYDYLQAPPTSSCSPT